MSRSPVRRGRLSTMIVPQQPRPLSAAVFRCRFAYAGLPGITDDATQKAGEIVGDVIDMRGVAAGEFPLLAKNLARAFRHHQHPRHSEPVRAFEIAREVLEDRRFAGVDIVAGGGASVEL